MVRYVPQPSSKTKVDIDDDYVGLGGICLLRGWSKVTQKKCNIDDFDGETGH